VVHQRCEIDSRILVAGACELQETFCQVDAGNRRDIGDFRQSDVRPPVLHPTSSTRSPSDKVTESDQQGRESAAPQSHDFFVLISVLEPGSGGSIGKGIANPLAIDLT
jgi:hypothetical protein